MNDVFRLKENNVTVASEIVCGFTTFITMLYILFLNSAILSATGMPFYGIFIATALTSAICSFIVAFYANLPFAMAPGMGLNAFFVQMLCIHMGYQWQEALAITFISGILHVIIVINPRLRRAFLNAIPEYLKVAAGVGLGLFIAYEGIKSAGFLSFSSVEGSYSMLPNNTVITDSSIAPGFIDTFNTSHILFLVSVVTMAILMMLQNRTKEKYAFIPISIILATFVGIPLRVTSISEMPVLYDSMFESFKTVAFSFFGETGLFSLFSDAETIVKTIMIILVMTTTGLMNSMGTITGVGLIGPNSLIDKKNLKNIHPTEATTKFEKVMLAESLGGVVAPVLGSSTAVTYIESASGVITGARTGLTSFTVGALFLLIIPLAKFSYIIPSEATAAALIFAGTSMIASARRISWRKVEELFPAALTILLIPLSYDMFSGLAIGILFHIIFQIAKGNFRQIHPVLYIILALFLTYKIMGI